MHACLSFGKNGMIFPMIRWKDALEKLILLKFIFWLQTKNYVDLVTLTGGWPGTWLKPQTFEYLQNPPIYNIKYMN